MQVGVGGNGIRRYQSEGFCLGLLSTTTSNAAPDTPADSANECLSPVHGSYRSSDIQHQQPTSKTVRSRTLLNGYPAIVPLIARSGANSAL